MGVESEGFSAYLRSQCPCDTIGMWTFERIVLVESHRINHMATYLFLPCISQMRFLNCTGGRKDPSRSILDVGVEEAIKFSGFDEKMFLKRGGKYVWSKADLKLDW